MTNEELRRDVADELSWDPKVDSDSIAVSVYRGIVTLRGTVGSLREMLEATKAAERVHGVVFVDNLVEVRLLTKDRRRDADLRGDVLQALMLDVVVPETVDAKVKDGVVTLTGTARRQYQRDEAEFVAGNVPGVIRLKDEIDLTVPEPQPADVRHAIGKAFRRNAKVEADSIDVQTIDGTVTLTGTVRSWAEHDAAVSAAWGAPGVAVVDDRITVQY
jgi:osmotically-inducible protein OsmY